MNFRPLRVAGLIQEELSKLIIREVDIPEGALATIVGVDVDRKLEHAKIRVSIFPKEKEKEGLAALVKRQGDMQYLLMKKINIKPMPRIAFEKDSGHEAAAQVEKIAMELGDELKDKAE
jgi:ribosome-binding factor A